MFKTITSATSATYSYITLVKEIRKSNKEMRIRQIEGEMYAKMIAESQAKLAETTLVPGHTNVYA